MSEKETKLLLKSRSGDIKAFHALFADFQPQLKSYLYRLTAVRNDADDLTHDAFVKAFDKLATFQEKSTLKTWVFRIGTNLAIDLLRQRQRWPEDAQDQSKASSLKSPHVVEAYLTINEHSPDGRYEMREHIDFCFTCIAKTLPIEQQVTLILKEVYGFKVKEVASILETTVSRCQHLLRAARQTMIDIFDQRCSLVNKDGVCYQCSELNRLFNPKQDAQIELMKIEMVKTAVSQDKVALFNLRTQLVRHIDPLNANGTDLHAYIMKRVRTVIGEE